MINRNLSGVLPVHRKSVLLLGPRQVGKSTLIKSLNPHLSFNLADERVFVDFTSNPDELRNQLSSRHGVRTVFVDEIQRYPALLNSIQALLDENKNLKFYLTGSSARKLKRGQANLLPGRVLNYFLGPLVASELDYKANTEKIMQFGGLPEVYTQKNEGLQRKILNSYLVNYIHEEIRAEAIVRNVDSFSRALPHVFSHAGLFVDYSKIAKRAKVSRHSLSRFYEIFEDTLVGYRAWPDAKLIEKADLVKHPRFYAFDMGVLNASMGSFELNDQRKGLLFEHLVYTQMLHSAWSKDRHILINTFRTRGGLEVDFVVTLDGVRLAVEAKSTPNIIDTDVASLKSLRQDYEPSIEITLVYTGKVSKKINGVWCRPWQEFLKSINL